MAFIGSAVLLPSGLMPTVAPTNRATHYLPDRATRLDGCFFCWRAIVEQGLLDLPCSDRQNQAAQQAYNARFEVAHRHSRPTGSPIATRPPCRARTYHPRTQAH